MSTYTPIASQTLSTSTTSVTFSSIPQNYSDLIIIVNGTLTSDENNYLSINGINNAGSYSVTRLYGSSSARGSNRSSSQNTMQCGEMGTNQSSDIIQILNYSNTATHKTVLSRSGNSNGNVKLSVGLSQGTSPVTSITLTAGSTYSSGCTFTLYGIAAGNSSAKATGGNIVTTDGSYWYHTFISTGTFIPSQALTVDYLVVAGGGGGGYPPGGGGAGGGGAGGLLTLTSQSLSASTVYPCLIGAGGIAGNGALPGSGNNTVFNGSTAIGGGRSDTAGGSGGGGGYQSNGGTGTSGQGNAGGNGSPTGTPFGGGGGGGAGAAGTAASSNGGGANGGIGSSSSISGTATYYAGGGGGGSRSGSVGSGGNGGGGTGSSSSGTPATSGSPYTGGGGGGGSDSGYGGKGGSGIVVVRYAV
jgi:hypothetical protein